ncbi:armadillo-type protein [Fimicolochytrium jonesii]|uniref:armadillo-type protein n=1 Tax=Fimicolochytrium jonesii TaxID=1396493 RepID=UPI0022FE60F8|nr:armadillo-type protein [Fimicolochytrium jonesii]KAI8820144.1 armadillo-type protein [Fimicolochytrium jonesii]
MASPEALGGLVPDSAGRDLTFASNDLFVKIRTQTNSGLDNQKQAALILAAVEETITEQGEQLTPLAYFGALMTILSQQATGGEAVPEAQGLVAAATYLLAIVFPRVPSAILKLKFEDIAKTVGVILEMYQEDQPLVRAVLACFEFLLAAQDSQRWTSDVNCRKLMQVLLIMSVDGRPKVRRRAHEAIRRLLAHPPPPSVHHPATLTIIEFAVRGLEEYTQSVEGTGSANDRKESEQNVLHVLVFLKAVIPSLALQGGHGRTSGKLHELCEKLLRLPVRSSGTGNTVLTQWIFSVLDALFGADADKDGIFPELDVELLDSVIRALLEIRPYQNDATLIPTWLALIGRGFRKLAELVNDVENTKATTLSSEEWQYALQDYPELLVGTFSTLFEKVLGQQSTKPVILAKAADVFADMFRNCITDSMIVAPVVQGVKPVADTTDSQLLTLLYVVNSGLTDIRYRAAWGGILRLAEALFDSVGSRKPTVMKTTLVNIIAFRDDRAYGGSFPYKEELEVSLHAAVQAIGLETFVEWIPLNIEVDSTSNATRRPYLLATFVEALNRPLPKRSNKTRYGPHSLRFLGTTLLPLAQRLLEKSGASWTAKREVEAKLYETLGAQIWAMVPAICSTVPSDVHSSFSVVAPFFGKILQAQPTEAYANLPSNPDFRPTVCDAIVCLIEGYEEVVSLSADNAAELKLATDGIARLMEYANRFLSVICNNYTTVNPDLLQTSKAKGQQLQALHERETQRYARTIGALLLIAEEKAVTSYFLNLVTTLLQSQSHQEQQTEQATKVSPAVQLERLRDYAILDLLLILLPFLPEVKNRSKSGDAALPADSPLLLFYKVLTGQLRESDPTMQKRTYKCLNQVVPKLPRALLGLEELIERVLDPEVLSKASSGAKNARIQLLQWICNAIPLTEKALLLQFIPISLSEVMLATKEASEKARNAAYECLVAMGNKMLEDGGVGDPTSEGRMDTEGEVDEDPAKKINLSEFFTMVIAGLAGETSTMQSASIAALSRLVFEFGPLMDERFVRELVSTINFVMNTTNREVIKAALGFMKVVIVCLRQEVLEDELENIVVAILTHSRNHKSHFKAKVRHIFERLVRRFSYEAIEGFVPEGDKKLLVNIKKRREREKKKKRIAKQLEAGEENDSDGEASKAALLAGKGAAAGGARKQFEDALYGSESELETDAEDSDDDDDEKYIPDRFKDALQRSKGKSAAPSSTRIREGGEDDVADFLDARIVSRVTSAPRKGKRAGANGSAQSDFQSNEDGRLMINDSDDEGEGVAGATAALDAMEVTQDREDHYKAALHSEVAFTRTADGRVKFLRPNESAKRKRGDADPEAEENRGATASGLGWGQGRNKRKDVGLDKGEVEKMLGRQFKAKRAKGDVKKSGGPDPFAYIPLTSKVVGGKKRKAAKVAGQFKNIIKATQTGGSVNTGKGSSSGPNSSGAGASGSGVKKGNKKHK